MDKIWFDSKSFLPNIHPITDYIKPIFKFDKNFNLDIPDRSLWKDKTLPTRNTTNFYTDGSFMNESAGGGIYSESPSIEVSIPLGTHCSIYLAEVAAIIKCCNLIEDLNLTERIIVIYTDSESAIKALRSHSRMLGNLKQLIEFPRYQSYLGSRSHGRNR